MWHYSGTTGQPMLALEISREMGDAFARNKNKRAAVKTSMMDQGYVTVVLGIVIAQAVPFKNSKQPRTAGMISYLSIRIYVQYSLIGHLYHSDSNSDPNPLLCLEHPRPATTCLNIVFPSATYVRPTYFLLSVVCFPSSLQFLSLPCLSIYLC